MKKISKHTGNFKLKDKYGFWEVIDENIYYDKINEAVILVRCKCGKEKKIRCSYLIKNPNTKCINCKKGANHPNFVGYKEIPGRWFSRIKKKKFALKITIKDIHNLWIKQDKKCALTGIPIDFINENKDTSDLICNASLDRINSNKGYIKGNIQLVHKDVNIMKNAYKQERFIEICKLVTEKNKLIC